MEPVVVGLAVALVGASIGVAVLLLSQRRTRRQVEGLMDRLDELEQRLHERQEATGAGESAEAPVDSARYADEGLSRDVLAGRTSFVRRAVDGELSRPASLAGQTIALIHEHIRESVTAAELADELAISLRSLERGLAAELGCSPRQLILAMKMREARRLLATGRLRVNEVSNQLGFANPSHFSRSFRTFYRVPPSSVGRSPRP